MQTSPAEVPPGIVESARHPGPAQLDHLPNLGERKLTHEHVGAIIICYNTAIHVPVLLLLKDNTPVAAIVK